MKSFTGTELFSEHHKVLRHNTYHLAQAPDTDTLALIYHPLLFSLRETKELKSNFKN